MKPEKGGALVASIATYGGRLAAALIQALALIELARAVPPTTVGVVTIAISVASTVGLMLDFGVGMIAARSHARGESDHTAHLMKLHHRLMVLAGILVLLGGACFVWIGGGEVSLALLFLAPWVVVERRNTVLLSLAVAGQRAIRAAVSITVSRLISLSVWVVVERLLPVDPVRGYIGFLIASAIISSLLLPRHPTTRKTAPTAFAKSAFSEARPFWVASLSAHARTLDSLVLGAVAGPLAAGLYAFPSRAVAPMRLIATSLGAVAMPVAARRDRPQLQALERGMWLMSTFFVAAAVAFFFFGEGLMIQILGESYSGSAALVSILSVGVAINMPGALWSATLQGAGGARFVARLGVILVGVFYVLLVVGSLFFGAVGAACGVVGTFLIQFLVMLVMRTRRGWIE